MAREDEYGRQKAAGMPALQKFAVEDDWRKQYVRAAKNATIEEGFIAEDAMENRTSLRAE